MAISDVTQFVASDYEMNFTGATAGTIKRTSDGKVTNFDFSTTNPVVLDGLAISEGNVGGAAAGDKFLFKPFATSASNVAREFSTPRALAVSNPIAATLTPTNSGSLALASLTAKTVATTAAAPIDNYRIAFTVTAGVTTYNIVDTTTSTTVAAGQPYVSGQPIAYTPAGLPGFSMTLTGTPSDTDSITIGQNAYAALNGGNASSMMDLRDVAMFDGAALTDGYAAYSADVSTNIAINAEKNRAGVAGVNLDEEAAKLLQYQQAYQASAKMIQVAQSIFDTLIQTMR
jgi:flagellar hook-associated protein 1 FlgK